jgi:hypothetical protein
LAHSDAKQRLGRVGLASRGVVFLLMAVLIAQIAAGGPAEDDADTAGALAALAEQPGGVILLGLVVLGLLAHALWRFVQVYTSAPVGDEDEGHTHDEGGDDENILARTPVRRIGYAAVGAFYVGLAVLGTMIATQEAGGGDGEEAANNGDEEAQALTATVLDWPGGEVLVGAVGLGFIIAALWHVQHGLRLNFEDRLKTEEMSTWQRPMVRVVAIAAMLGRFLAFGAIGWFIVSSAVQYDPDEPMGLDEVLREVAAEPWGTAAIAGVAFGFACYGLLSFIEARWRTIPLE